MKKYTFATPEGESKYVIYLRSTNQRVPCTKKQFEDYYRDINAYRRTQQNHGRCKCPPSKWLMCDMDCLTCPYHTFGDTSCLDANLVNEDDKEMTWLEYLQEIMPELQSVSIEESAIARLYAQKILVRIKELMPEAIEIGKLRLQGLSDAEISERIGIPRMTFRDRIEVLRQKLSEENLFSYDGYVFVDEMGERMRPGYLTTSFPKFLESHGMPHMRFHDLRHSCASLLLANGVPLKHIQEWLGHSDFSTTANIYAHLDYTSKITSAQAMEGGITLPSSQFSSRWTDDLDDDFSDTDEQV